MTDFLLFTDNFQSSYGWSRSCGAYRVATHLNNNGIRARVIDGCMSISSESIKKIVERLNPRYVGVSTTFFSYTLKHFISTLVEKAGRKFYWFDKSDVDRLLATLKDTGRTIFVGGANSYSHADGFDYRIDGYGEDTLLDLLKNLQAGRKPLNRVLEASNSFMPDWSVDYHPHDYVKPTEQLTIETSRGCRFKCRFCSYPLNGRKSMDYLRDVESVRQEILRNYEQWGVTRFRISDDTFNETDEKVDAFCSMFDTLPREISFFAFLRAELMVRSPAQWERLRTSRIRSCFIGLESDNPKSLAAIGKGLGGEKTYEFLDRFCSDNRRSFIQVGFIAGLPGDSRDSVRAMSDRLGGMMKKHPNLSVQMTEFIINRDPKKRYKSEFDKDAERFGYTFTEDGWINPNGYTSTEAREDAVAIRASSPVLNIDTSIAARNEYLKSISKELLQ